jgi:hypothetical protein
VNLDELSGEFVVGLVVDFVDDEVFGGRPYDTTNREPAQTEDERKLNRTRHKYWEIKEVHPR